MSHDPKGYIDGMNLYQAFGGNPVNFRDPYGLCSVCKIKKDLPWLAGESRWGVSCECSLKRKAGGYLGAHHGDYCLVKKALRPFEEEWREHHVQSNPYKRMIAASIKQLPVNIKKDINSFAKGFADNSKWAVPMALLAIGSPPIATAILLGLMAFQIHQHGLEAFATKSPYEQGGALAWLSWTGIGMKKGCARRSFEAAENAAKINKLNRIETELLSSEHLIRLERSYKFRKGELSRAEIDRPISEGGLQVTEGIRRGTMYVYHLLRRGNKVLITIYGPGKVIVYSGEAPISKFPFLKPGEVFKHPLGNWVKPKTK